MLTDQPAMAAATGPALSVDVSAARHAISNDIYGLNGGDPAFNAEIGQSVARWGGNATSRYNFRNRTYNTGSDWYFENIVADEAHSVEGMVKSNLDRGIKPVVAVPLVGWVAKDSPSSHPFNCGFPATRFPQQDSFDQWDANCGNGQLNQQNLAGVATDTSIRADAAFDGDMVTHLVDQFGTAEVPAQESYDYCWLRLPMSGANVAVRFGLLEHGQPVQAREVEPVGLLRVFEQSPVPDRCARYILFSDNVTMAVSADTADSPGVTVSELCSVTEKAANVIAA
ncbi:glycoside hydrolase family 44 protein, partial [Kibdelosporangium lantanae]